MDTSTFRPISYPLMSVVIILKVLTSGASSLVSKGKYNNKNVAWFGGWHWGMKEMNTKLEGWGMSRKMKEGNNLFSRHESFL